MVLTMAMVTLISGGAILFLKGVREFKSGLRAAYRWFAVGLILFGASLLQWPIVALTGKYGDFWASSGAVIIPFAFATAFMYIGMRRFARLLGVSTILLSIPFSVGAVSASAVLSGVLAHFVALNNGPGIDTETYTATVAWSTGYGFLAWLLILKIWRVIGAEYRKPMRWLLWALGALVVSGSHEYVTSYFLSENDWYVYWGASLWPFIIAGFLFLRAGYAFIAGYGESAQTSGAAEGDKSRGYIDGIILVANLASRPPDIDAALDGLRKVTSRLAPGAGLSEEQYAQLVAVYLNLEHYLTTLDPLRNFTKEQLRTRITPAFRARVERAESPAQTLSVPLKD
jgi:hypothetical protein